MRIFTPFEDAQPDPNTLVGLKIVSPKNLGTVYHRIAKVKQDRVNIVIEEPNGLILVITPSSGWKVEWADLSSGDEEHTSIERL